MNWVFFSIVIAFVVAVTAFVAFMIWKADAPQVYLYYDKNSLPTTLAEAQNIAATPMLAGQLATPAQVQASQQAGAEWCAAGWATDGNVYFPMQTQQTGCGAPGVNKSSCSDFGNTCGVLVYGKKPSSGTASVYPFNGSQWSQWKWYDPLHS